MMIQDSLSKAYEELMLHLGCEFCLEGPLECECVDVDVDVAVPYSADLDAGLEATDRRFEAFAKLGRDQTDRLLTELSLDAADEASWKTLESLAMWL
jgi:hypothetical protein